MFLVDEGGLLVFFRTRSAGVRLCEYLYLGRSVVLFCVKKCPWSTHLGFEGNKPRTINPKRLWKTHTHTHPTNKIYSVSLASRRPVPRAIQGKKMVLVEKGRKSNPSTQNLSFETNTIETKQQKQLHQKHKTPAVRQVYPSKKNTKPPSSRAESWGSPSILRFKPGHLESPATSSSYLLNLYPITCSLGLTFNEFNRKPLAVSVACGAWV